jgi:hypothetical protein
VYKKISKSPDHSFLVTRLARLLQGALPTGWLLRAGQPFTCGVSEPEPDLAFVLGSEQDFCEDNPHTAELVIELCITSHEYDRSKLPAYASAGVKEAGWCSGRKSKSKSIASRRLGYLPNALSRDQTERWPASSCGRSRWI